MPRVGRQFQNDTILVVSSLLHWRYCLYILFQESLSSGATASSMQGNTHIFQALRYLQNVCNHPKLVLNQAHPSYQQIVTQLQRQNSRLEDICHSAKLPALM